MIKRVNELIAIVMSAMTTQKKWSSAMAKLDCKAPSILEMENEQLKDRYESFS